MNYIDHSEYNDMLKKFAQGSKKEMLQEGYVDLRPIGTFEGKITDIGATVNQNYPDHNSMEEAADVTNPGKYAGGPRAKFDKDGDGVPDGADKSPTDGSRHEGLQIGKPTGATIQTTEGRGLKSLSPDEQTQLKEYVRSMKTIKKAIQELLDKAKGSQMEGGNMTDLTLM